MLEFVFYLSVICCGLVNSFPDQGQWTKSYFQVSKIMFGMHKTLYSGSTVSLSVNCEPSSHSKKVNITISWVLRQTSCYEEYLGPEVSGEYGLTSYFDCPMTPVGYSRVRFIDSKIDNIECSLRIHLEPSNSSFTTNGKNSMINRRKNCLSGPSIYPDEGSEITVNQDTKSNNVESDLKTTKSEDSKNSKRKIRNVVSKDKNVVDKTVPGSQTNADSHKAEETEQIEGNPGETKQDSQVNATPEKDAKGVLSMSEVRRKAVKDSKNANWEKRNVLKGENEVFESVPGSQKNADSHKPEETDKTKENPGERKDGSQVKATTEKDTKGVLSMQDVNRKAVKPSSLLKEVDMDGVYLFILNIRSTNGENFNLTVDVTMKGEYGYLSAVDWPLLPFYGFMCGIYVIYAFAWLFVSALQWRDLLRIQFWIGGVILLGLMEKAVFYAEYQSINSTGQSVQGAVLFAEILSCMKRTLARMLVIIVSLGFGIVKPRLGPMLHRVVGVGGLYFILGTTEGCLRVLKPKNDPSNQALMAGIPLAVTDSAICWWIFSSLVQTIRTLRLRRNIVKLSLYRHFTNTLIFAVLASVAYMIWSIHSHKLVNCITDWKELWVDEAYWHLLFSIVLVVIMILWRPTNNNQRYAFTPLLDAADDDEDEEDDLNPPNDAFAGMKMRTNKNQSNMSPKQNDAKNKPDEDLKWVEENIPSSLTDTALPSLLDSDEEIMTAKFERSKME